MSRKKRRLGNHESGPIDLNVMPFIDVFSLLTTFLLFSAVFTHIGIVEVQVPFLTNQPPPEDKKPERTITVNVIVDKESIEVETYFVIPPKNSETKTFRLSKGGIQEMHDYLISVRSDHPETDKLSLLPTDDVEYDDVMRVIDAAKYLSKSDPPLPSSENIRKDGSSSQYYLYPKVIMGNILF